MLSSLQKTKLESYLKNLAKNNEVLESLLLATPDGNLLVFSSFVKIELEKNHLAAMSASLSGLSIALAESCGKHKVIGGIVETEDGIIISGFLPYNNQNIVMLCLFTKEVQHGLALWNFKSYKRDLNTILVNNQ